MRSAMEMALRSGPLGQVLCGVPSMEGLAFGVALRGSEPGPSALSFEGFLEA